MKVPFQSTLCLLTLKTDFKMPMRSAVHRQSAPLPYPTHHAPPTIQKQTEKAALHTPLSHQQAMGAILLTMLPRWSQHHGNVSDTW